MLVEGVASGVGVIGGFLAVVGAGTSRDDDLGLADIAIESVEDAVAASFATISGLASIVPHEARQNIRIKLKINGLVAIEFRFKLLNTGTS